MVKRKVIEDSDDEDEETTPRRQRSAVSTKTDASTIVSHENHSQQDKVHQSTDPSTGSSELLNREIRAAHKSLVDPTPEGTAVSMKKDIISQRQPRSSPTSSRSKIQRAKTTIERPRTKKPLKKFGTVSANDIFEFRGDNGDDELKAFRWKGKEPTPEASTRDLFGGGIVALEAPKLAKTTFVRNGKEVPGMEMMPPLTSKATPLDPTELSGAATVAVGQSGTIAGSECDSATGAKDLRSHDVTHSDFEMPTPTISSRRSAEDCDRTPSRIEVESSSNVSACPPQEITVVDRQEQTLQTSPIDDTIIGDGASSLRVINDIPITINPVVLLPDKTNLFEERDELSLPTHGPETWSINQTSFSKAQKRKRESDEPGSDDVHIGLPKDRYQPRPSKSRSGRGADNVIVPVDFSKKPEVLAKKKDTTLKRRKTTAFHELLPTEGHHDMYEESMHDLSTKCPEICGEDPVILDTGKGQVDERKDEGGEDLEEGQVGDMEGIDPNNEPLVMPVVTKKQRGRPKKGAPLKLADELTTHGFNTESPNLAANLTSTKESSLINPKKGRRNARPAARLTSKDLVCDSDDELDDVDDLIRAPRDLLSEISGNGPVLICKEAVAASPPPPTIIATAPQTPCKGGSSSEKGPDKHSPISSGKVAYRVGLSKRARIAPLLRIVRKA